MVCIYQCVEHLFVLDLDSHTSTILPQFDCIWLLTFRSGCDASEAAEALSAQEISKHISEGASSTAHLGALLHSDLPLGLSTAGFADFCALSPGVSVAAAGERPGQPLLC